MKEDLSINQEIIDNFNRPIVEVSSLRQWLFGLIKPYVKGKVLQLGGDGEISTLFVQTGLALRISDPKDSQCELLQKRFNGEPMIKGIHQLDLTDEHFDKKYQEFLGRFHTTFSVNFINRKSDDPATWNNAKKLLRERGHLIMLLPVPTVLYDESDEGLEEWNKLNRRYVRNLVGKDPKIMLLRFFAVSENQAHFGEIYQQQVQFFQPDSGTSFLKPGLYMVAFARITSAESNTSITMDGLTTH